MNSPTIAYALAALMLVAARFALARSDSHAPPPHDEQTLTETHASLWRLLLASFLVLFAELAFIRWIAVEARVFAYFKNLALLLCFLGFGMGCALSARRPRWQAGVKALFGLLLVVRLPYLGHWALEGLSQSLGASADMNIWGTNPTWNLFQFLGAGALAALLFLLIVFVFVPLGQVVSRQMDLAPRPLAAYSWNLAASLAGLFAFLAVSRLMLPPWFWLGTVLLGFALLQSTAASRLLVASLLIPLVLLLHDPSDRDHFIRWTPYQQIQFTRSYTSNGEMQGGTVRVNHTGYQFIADLDPNFLQRHPELVTEPLDENPYNLPFRFAAPSPEVLIVGSGTGNDAAAALRNGSSSVDAVEIDPAILAVGRTEHPEHPYDSRRVHVHLTDARAFLKRTTKQYDIILFGLLDSHTQLSDYSNMRLDNFVYTEESFREAKARLKPDGVVFIKFQVDHGWLGRRLRKMLTATFGKPPEVFVARSSYAWSATCFVIGPSNRVQDAIAGDPRLAYFVTNHPVILLGTTDVPVTTDDWPYLYQESKSIPRLYWSVAVIILLLAFGLYTRIPETAQHRPSLFFFSMGAGFLLLETQVISRLALFFGTTWQVNGIVISAMLAALLLANIVVEQSPRPIPALWSWTGLLLGLAIAYWFPFDRIAGSPAFAGVIAVSAFSLPVIFAGILFSTEFRNAESPGAALGANMLGAVVGGMLENLSLLFGMRALLLVAIAVYCLAGIGLLRNRRHAGAIPLEEPALTRV
jgi:SAM-dependent methyltransferase